MTLTVNGTPYEVAIEPRQSLLQLLREELHLTGTKEGCSEGECGACTVLLDGKTVDSCLIFALEAQGREVTTIEWLGGAMRVVGVVLAAGESRRMGRLKALLPFGAHTVIEHVLQPLLQADLAAVTVVLGHRAADIAAVLKDLPVHLLYNPQYQHGMTTSVQVALRDITPVPDAY